MFNFFKKKKAHERITVNEIDSWLKKTYESKNISFKISVFKRELNSKKIKIKELLHVLSHAKIKDESVMPERAKNMFYGNKDSYVQKVNLFLDKIEFPENISSIEDFLVSISEKLEELAQDTNKNYFIIKEFADDEIRQVANKLKELDNLISTMRANIEKTSLGKFKELTKLLDDYRESKLKAESDKKMLNEVLERKAEELDRRKKIEAKINILKSSPKQKEYSKLLENKNSIEEQIKKLEYAIIDLFSGISIVLKKYGKSKKNELAIAYSDNAIDALKEDESLKILDVLNKVDKNKSSLDIKDTKLKKFESEISNINKAKLTKFKQDLIKLNQDLHDINNRIKNHSFKLDLLELEGRLEIIDQNLEDISKEEEGVENILERNNPNLIKQKMKYVIKEIDETTELI
ncbi:MAG: hypothetical protein ACOC1P_00945 [Minisyncoccales bacterium]